MLLSKNKRINTNQVMKLVLRNPNTNDILYFENSILINLNLSENVQYNEQDIDKVTLSENWYLPILSKQHKTIKNEDEASIAGVEYVTLALEDNDYEVINEKNNDIMVNKDVLEKIDVMAATSPVYGISASAFKTPGKYHYLDSDAYGYFRQTNEWPVGTGNMITQLIKWNTITNAPVPGGAAGVANLAIEVEAQYLYNATNDTISLFDNSSYLRIKNPAVQLGLLTGNSDIITRVEKKCYLQWLKVIY